MGLCTIIAHKVNECTCVLCSALPGTLSCDKQRSYIIKSVYFINSSTEGNEVKNTDLKGSKKEKKSKKLKMMSSLSTKSKPIKEMISPPPSPSDKHQVTTTSTTISTVKSDTKSDSLSTATV